MFPLPGAPRQQVMDPSRLQTLMNQPSGGASNAALKPSNARQSKRLFIHNLPSSATEDSIIGFFNLQLNGLNVIEGVDPCISCHFSNDRHFAMIEFKTPSDATVAQALDGISMEDDDAMVTTNGNGDGGSGLSIRRPRDYIVAAVTDDEGYTEGVVSSSVADTQNKISIRNIIPNLDDEQVKELLASFGALKSFVLVKDKSTEESRVCLLMLHCNRVTNLIRESLSVNMSNKALRTLQSKGSTAWSSAINSSKSSERVSAWHKLLASK